MSQPSFPEQLRPKTGAAAITKTVSTTAIALGTTDVVDPVAIPFLLVEVKTNGISVTFDGTTATASNGHLLASGYREVWSAQKWNAASVIRSGGADATLLASPMTI